VKTLAGWATSLPIRSRRRCWVAKTLIRSSCQKEAEPIRKMLKFERDLQKQVQALMEEYRETRRELRLSPENIKQVVSVGLALAGQPDLVPAKTDDGKPCFILPPLKEGGRHVLQGLEHPHTKDLAHHVR